MSTRAWLSGYKQGWTDCERAIPSLTMPRGWRLYSADFSIEGRLGSVMLTLTGEAYQAWLRGALASDETPELYVTGRGDSFDAALADAIRIALTTA